MKLLNDIIILAATLLAAITLGNLFLTELRKARERKAPWYAPYLTLPGILVLAALCSPIIAWIIR
jgi:hypothetical protein